MTSPVLRELIRAYCHHSPLDRGKYRLALWAWQHLPSPAAPVRARLGKTLDVELDPADLIQSQIYYIGYYEFYLARYFCGLIYPSITFADVGAHIGQYTLLAAERGAVVHAFEPNPDNYLRLQRNVAANGFSHVILNQTAVSNHTGTSPMFLPDKSNSGSGSLRNALPNSAAEITVHTTTLDNYFDRIPCPQMIKMDIEGAELLALRGAMNVLRQWRPILILEASSDSARAFGYTVAGLIGFVRDLNYQCFTLDRLTLKPLPIDFHSNYDNLICLPHNSFSRAFDEKDHSSN
jgi:FkbM family methyltransferase